MHRPNPLRVPAVPVCDFRDNAAVRGCESIAAGPVADSDAAAPSASNPANEVSKADVIFALLMLASQAWVAYLLYQLAQPVQP